MSERAALDSYIETLQILAREGDTDRTDEERERDAAHRAKLIDAFAHELAEQIRSADGPIKPELLVGGFWWDERDREHAANLIDPNEGPVRPGEEPTT